MTNLIGAYQYFDDSFLQDTFDYQRPIVQTATDELTKYLQEHHPKWLWIMRKAKRLCFFQQDLDHSYTMFVPDESTFSTIDLMNLDIQYCLMLFNRHVVHGRITRDVLDSSPIQQISSLTSGEPLYIKQGMINNVWKIIEYNISIENITIHVIHPEFP